MSEKKKLTKSDNKVIAGVCGGLAEYIGMDPTLLRVIYAILTVCTAFCGVLIYIILYFVMPKKGTI